MYRACVVHITFQYPEEYTEVLPDDPESTEVAIEAGVSIKLAELFGGEILVDDVTLENIREESSPNK
jgi:hypothetical protein